MAHNFSKALNKSLALLETGDTTLAECLARYPEYADDLRSLLGVAFEVSRVPSPTSTPAAFAAGKQRMFQALAEKKRRAASPDLVRRFEEWLVDLFSRRPAAQGRVSTFRLALATVAALALLALAAVLFPSWLNPTITRAATVSQVNGVVEILPAGSVAWEHAEVGMLVNAGDGIRTGPSSTALLTFFDASTTNMESETEIAVIQMNSRRDGGGKVILLRQTLGQTCNRVQPLLDSSSRFEIETPTASTAVRGTEFSLTVAADGATHVMVVEGVVNVTAQAATVSLLAGQETTVQPGRPPITGSPITTPTTTTATAVPVSTPTATFTVSEQRDQAGTPQPPGLTRTPQPPGPTNTPQPPGLTKTPQPPGPTKTPQPPGLTKTPQPPGLTKTPQPPGLTKTPEPPGLTKTPEPPGQPDHPEPTKHPKKPKK